MVTVAYLPSFGELIAVLQQGKMSVEDAQKVQSCSYLPSVINFLLWCAGNRDLY